MRIAQQNRIKRDGYMQSPKTREKLSIAQQKRIKRDGYMNSSKARKKISEAHKDKPLSEEHKRNIGIAVTGENHYRWNPNREEANAPYTETVSDKKFRADVKVFQRYRDLFNGDPLEKSAHLHHFNGIKSDDSHFVKGDDRCNVGFVNPCNHGHPEGKKKERKIKILIENTSDLKNNQIPRHWTQLNKELLTKEIKQLDLNS